MSTAIREPAVAGAFYPLGSAELSRQVAKVMSEEQDQHELLVCIAPHAGYIYSGGVAGKVYSHLHVPRRVLVLGPNHTGMGAKVSVAPHSAWQIPLGPVPVDRELAELLLAAYPKAESEAEAHWREHSIEVQLPFLLRQRSDVTFVPVCIKHLSYNDCVKLGEAIARVVIDCSEPIGIVVSSDMSHFEPDQAARKLDQMAIDAALSLNPLSLYETVIDNRISMCGVMPATVALAAARSLDTRNAHLVDYATSGDTSGDRSSVVGYAGICIHR